MSFLPFAGGIATYCYELAYGLCSNGHEVTIVAPKTGPVSLTTTPFRIEWIKLHDDPISMAFTALKRFRDVAKQYRPDVILVNDRHSLAIASVSRYLRLKGRLVPIVHGVSPSHIRRGNSRSLPRRLLEREMNRFYRSRSLVICVSSHMRSLFLASRFATPHQHVAVVHNGMKSPLRQNSSLRS